MKVPIRYYKRKDFSKRNESPYLLDLNKQYHYTSNFEKWAVKVHKGDWITGLDTWVEDTNNQIKPWWRFW